MFRRSSRGLLHASRGEKEEGSHTVIVVGDTMETDMSGAVEVRLRTYFVSTGSS